MILFLIAVASQVTSNNSVAYSTSFQAQTSAPRDPNFCLNNPNSQACQIQNDYLAHHLNDTSTSSPPVGSLPILAFYNKTSNTFVTGQSSSPGQGVQPAISGLSGQPYVAASGYQTAGQYSGGMHSVQTTIQYSGTSGRLSGYTLSGGLNVHVIDTMSAVDYLLQFYAYAKPNGYENIAYAVYSACAGFPYQCGPAYGNCIFCPVQSITIASGSLSSIGNLNDPIFLYIYWNANYGYVFDYQDPYISSNYYTALALWPSGTYSTMAHNDMYLGQLNCGYRGYFPCAPSPPNLAYFMQVGFTMSGIPQNGYWAESASSTEYSWASSPGTLHWMDHAESIPWGIPSLGAPDTEYSYWKEVWTVSDVPAQTQGINIYGTGTSSNFLSIDYSGSPQSGGAQLW